MDANERSEKRTSSVAKNLFSQSAPQYYHQSWLDWFCLLAV